MPREVRPGSFTEDEQLGERTTHRSSVSTAKVHNVEPPRPDDTANRDLRWRSSATAWLALQADDILRHERTILTTKLSRSMALG
jgi:hypothetical protein